MAAYEIKADRIPEVLPSFYRSRRVPLFVGRPGISKTAMVREAAAQMSAGMPAPITVRELHLASMSEVDIRGYLVPHEGKAKFTAPEFWEAVQTSPYGILFLDEFPQASHEVQKAVAPLILEGRVGEYTLPPGWSVVLAGNRLDDNAGANTLLSHIVNRVTIINVVAPDPDEWAAWAVGANVPPELIAFAKLRPNVVFESEIPQAPDTPYCTPRSLHILGDVANHWPGGVRSMVDSSVGMSLLCGSIGEGPAGELSALVRTAINLPSYEEVVANPEGIALPTKPDQIYAMIMLVAVRAKLEHREPVVQFITRFDPNYAITGIISLMKRDRQFGLSKAMRDWVMGHQDMLLRFGKYISQSI